MKKVLYFSLLLLVPAFISCVEDLGNDTVAEINEIEISGIEESYSVIAKQETLVINPEVKGSLSASDESNLSYEWFLCDNGITDHNHYTIGTERNLSYFIESTPANYTLYFSVLDNSTGIKWEKKATLSVVSPMVRGFYLFGDKADGSVAMDFLSFIDGRDTSVVKDVFVNTKNLKGAKNAVFTGYYVTEDMVNMWVISESGSYQVDKSASSTEVKELDVMSNPGSFIFPTVPVSQPQQVMDIHPYPYAKANTNRARGARILFTKDNVFATGMMTLPEAYGNPINCYKAASADLFKPSKYILYKDNAASVSGVCMFDETNHCFVRVNSMSSYTAPTYCVKLSNTGTPFYFDQNQYSPVRTLVYGQNGYGNAGRSYALMNNENGEYFVYQIMVTSYSSITAQAAYTIDMSVAEEFAKADFYTFFSMQPIVLYSVGAKLYAYDYARNECKLVNTFDGNITYLSMDYESNNDPKHIWIATYNGSAGKVYGYSIADNQNAINVTPVEHEVFDTEIKVVKMEYRNHAN